MLDSNLLVKLVGGCGRDIQYRCRWQKLPLDDEKKTRSILMTWNRGHLKLKRAKPGLAVDK